MSYQTKILHNNLCKHNKYNYWKFKFKKKKEYSTYSKRYFVNILVWQLWQYMYKEIYEAYELIKKKFGLPY